jgi:hypothetical protein
MSKSVSFSFLNNLGYPTQKQRYIKCVASCYPYFTKNHLIREFFPQILENTFGLKYRGVLTEVFAQISLRLMHRFFPADLRGLPADSAEHFRLEISCKLLPKKPAEGSPKNPRYPRHPCSTPIRIIPRKNPRYPRHPCSTPIRVIPRKNPCHPCSTPIRIIPRKNPRYPRHPCSTQSASSHVKIRVIRVIRVPPQSASSHVKIRVIRVIRVPPQSVSSHVKIRVIRVIRVPPQSVSSVFHPNPRPPT